jgi:hypothetical protein
VNCSPGDRVAPPQNNVEKVANVIVVSENRERAVKRAEDVLDEILVVLRPREPETDAFLFVSGWADRYARYRVANRDTVAILSSPVDYRLTLARWAGSPPPLAVAPLPTLGGTPDHLKPNHISISAEDLGSRLESETLIRFDRNAERDVSVLFWRALIAGGRQGVRYLIDSINRHSGGVDARSGHSEGAES